MKVWSAHSKFGRVDQLSFFKTDWERSSQTPQIDLRFLGKLNDLSNCLTSDFDTTNRSILSMSAPISAFDFTPVLDSSETATSVTNVSDPVKEDSVASQRSNSMLSSLIVGSARSKQVRESKVVKVRKHKRQSRIELQRRIALEDTTTMNVSGDSDANTDLVSIPTTEGFQTLGNENLPNNFFTKTVYKPFPLSSASVSTGDIAAAIGDASRFHIDDLTHCPVVNDNDNMTQIHMIGLAECELPSQTQIVSNGYTSPIVPKKLYDLYGSSAENQYLSLVYFRRNLSKEKHPPIDEVIRMGAIPRIISFLHLDIDCNLQYEAVFCISYIACGDREEHGTVLFNNDVLVPLLALLCDTKYERVRDACMGCLGNISAYVDECRDTLLEYGIMKPLRWQLGLSTTEIELNPVVFNAFTENSSLDHLDGPSNNPSLTTIIYTSWCLSNLNKGETPIDPLIRRYTVEALSVLLFSPDPKVTLTVLSTLLTLCESSDALQNIQFIIDRGILKGLYDLVVTLSHKISSIDLQQFESRYLENDHSENSSGTYHYDPKSKEMGHELAKFKKTRKMLEGGVRVFAAILRSGSHIHRRIVLNERRFPLISSSLMQELIRMPATNVIEEGQWGGIRSKKNAFFNIKASEDDNSVVMGTQSTPSNINGVNSYEILHALGYSMDLDSIYEIKVEIVDAVTSGIEMDTTTDRRLTNRFLQNNILEVMEHLLNHNHYNLNYGVVHCLCALTTHLDFNYFDQVTQAAESAQHSQTQQDVDVVGNANVCVATIQRVFYLLSKLLVNMYQQTDLDTLDLLLKTLKSLASWVMQTNNIVKHLYPFDFINLICDHNVFVFLSNHTTNEIVEEAQQLESIFENIKASLQYE
jgi:hypothetical protein